MFMIMYNYFFIVNYLSRFLLHAKNGETGDAMTLLETFSESYT